jgi:DNA-binding FadR family transcriptional regulator
MYLSDSWTARQPPIARVSATEAVFSALRAAIESGDLAVGTKLSAEAALAAQYGVSRSVVREALRSCTALGLTATQTGKGTFVIAKRPASDLILGSYGARSLMEARPHIEVPAAELAAARRTTDQLDGLRGMLEAMAAEDDGAEWVGLDGSFHAMIASASGNEVFAKVVADIRDAMIFQSGTINLLTGRQSQSDSEHRAIVDAIARGDAAAAGRAMACHLAAVGEALAEIMGEDR